MKYSSFIFTALSILGGPTKNIVEGQLRSTATTTTNTKFSGVIDLEPVTFADTMARDLEETKKVLPVCAGGAFSPSSEKYYTIKHSDGRYASHVTYKAKSITTSTTIIRLQEDGVDARAHWRFIPSDNGEFLLKNRHTGLLVSSGGSPVFSGQNTTVNAACSSDDTGVAIGRFFKVVSGTERKTSSCKENDRTCGEIFGSFSDHS